MVGQRVLVPSVRVRILLSQPTNERPHERAFLLWQRGGENPQDKDRSLPRQTPEQPENERATPVAILLSQPALETQYLSAIQGSSPWL